MNRRKNRRKKAMMRLSPRRRGCFIRMLSAVQVLSVFPSWEGINHILLQFHLIQQSLPLFGGDTSHRTITASDTTSSAIRGNGCFAVTRRIREFRFVCPSQDGMNQTFSSLVPRTKRLPLAGGDVSMHSRLPRVSDASASHRRGCFVSG